MTSVAEHEETDYYREYARAFYSTMILSARIKELQEEKQALEAAQERAKFEKKRGE